jgi:peroxiredoxin
MRDSDKLSDMARDSDIPVHPLVAALEAEFQSVRNLELPLGARLGRIAAKVRQMSPEFGDAVDTFVHRLERARAGAAAPALGDVMPGFLLADETGRLRSLDELIADGPAAIVFVRGHWCPYCRLNAVGLAEIEARLSPVKLAVISPERQAYTTRLKAESGAGFPFLTDVGAGYALSINLAIWIDQAMAALIASAGWDVPAYHGDDAWVMPVPSVFLVGRDGVVAARHIDPDYRRRMELADILDAARRLA